MRRITSGIGWILVVALGVFATACQDASTPFSPESTASDDLSDPSLGSGGESGVMTLSTSTGTVDLIAGQSTDVGDVTISDDGTDLTVEIEMQYGWCLLEAHAAAGDTEDDIPQNKNGNPQPGQFDKTEYGTSVEYDVASCNEGTETLMFSLPDGGDDGNVAVAVHTVVLGPEQTMSLYSDGSASFLANTGPGTAAFTGECTNTTADRSGTAVPAWEPPNDSDPSLWDSQVDHAFSSSADWIWESYRVQNPVCGDVVEFTRSFDVPGYPTGGTLWSTADNGHEAWVNGTMTASNGVAGNWKTSDLGASFILIQGWQDVQISDLTGRLEPGANGFVFWAGNEYMNSDDGDDSSAGTVDSNPGGLIYEATITYRSPEETAWAEGTEFPFEGTGNADGGGNWGMYVTYGPHSACPAVTAASSDLVELSGTDFPTDVTQGGQTSENIQYFAEGVTSSHSGIPLNILADNSFEDDETADILADTPVCSYYVHFDDGDLNDGDEWNDQVLTFEAAPLGAITAGSTNNSDPFAALGFDTLCDTDPVLGASGVTYPASNPGTCGSNDDARGLEIVPNQDRVEFQSGNTVEFDMQIGPKHDSFRILLPAVGAIVPPSS